MSDLIKRLEAWARDMQVGRNCFGADQDLKEAAAALRAAQEREFDLRETLRNYLDAFDNNRLHEATDMLPELRRLVNMEIDGQPKSG